MHALVDTLADGRVTRTWQTMHRFRQRHADDAVYRNNECTDSLQCTAARLRAHDDVTAGENVTLAELVKARRDVFTAVFLP